MKLRQLYILLVAAVLAIALGACHHDTKEEEPQPRFKRTVLVYMVADNSLGVGGYDTKDIAEMTQAAASFGLNGCEVMVYHAPRNAPATLNRLTSGGLQPIKSYPYGEEYSIDVSRMQQVFADMRAEAPALGYGLVMWSHGNGWIENTTSRSPILRAFGDDRGYSMKIGSLAKALTGQNFSFIYFDCCHMATIEVAYELRSVTDYIAGSVSELPVDGMNYVDNLPVFTADEVDLVQAATNTFKYYDKLLGSNRTCTMSVINTAGLDRLARATAAIMDAAPEGPRRMSVQKYMLSSCTLYDFGHYIALLQDVDSALIDEWQAAMDEAVAYKAATPALWDRIRINNYSGLGCWVLEGPEDATYRGFNNLQWWVDVMSHHKKFNP